MWTYVGASLQVVEKANSKALSGRLDSYIIPFNSGWGGGFFFPLSSPQQSWNQKPVVFYGLHHSWCLLFPSKLWDLAGLYCFFFFFYKLSGNRSSTMRSLREWNRNQRGL